MRPHPDPLSPMPERLVQAAVQAGLDVVRDQVAASAWLARLVSVSAEWEDQPVADREDGTDRLKRVAAVVGFDSPSAEGTGHVPWFAD